MVDVCAVIVNYKAKDYLKNCLASIYDKTKDISFEVVVIDNFSGDGSVEMIKDFYPQVVLLEEKNNLGFAAANNKAVKACKGKYLIFLNPDTVLLNNCFKTLADFLSKNAQIDAVGPKILNSDKTVQFECARNFPGLASEFFCITAMHKLFPKSRLFGKYLMSYWDHNDARQVESLSGACFMVRNEVFAEYLFDELFFIYAEDTDFFFRLKKAAKKAYYLPEAEIIHVWGGSSRKSALIAAARERQAMWLYFKKNYNAGKAFFYRLMVLAASLGMLFICTVLLIFGLFGSKKIRYVLRRYIVMLVWSLGFARYE